MDSTACMNNEKDTYVPEQHSVCEDETVQDLNKSGVGDRRNNQTAGFTS
jgi:hypothetical protein